MQKLVALIVLAAIVGGALWWIDRWRWLAPDDEVFRVEVRGSPRMTHSEKVPSGNNTIFRRQWRAQPTLGKAEFAVLSLELKAPALDDSELTSILDGLVPELLNQRKDTRQRGDALLAGQLTKEYTADLVQDTHLRARAVVKAPRMYVVIFGYKGDKEPPGQADRFFASFAFR